MGEAEGTALGSGVGTDMSYVGVKVGDTVGALVGFEEGAGVGLPNLYVGVRVGVPKVGSAVGYALGAAVVRKMRVIGVDFEMSRSVASLMYTTFSENVTSSPLLAEGFSVELTVTLLHVIVTASPLFTARAESTVTVVPDFEMTIALEEPTVITEPLGTAPTEASFTFVELLEAAAVVEALVEDTAVTIALLVPTVTVEFIGAPVVEATYKVVPELARVALVVKVVE